MINLIKKIFYKEKFAVNKLINATNIKELKNFENLCKYSIKAIKNKKKIIFYGNGGSASDAQHLATELTVRYKINRSALPAISLSTDTSALTAIGNDFGFKKVFARQIEAIGNSGDIAIAITTSGNSSNLIEAAKIANKKKLITFCFSGNKGGKLKKFTRYPIIIPSNVTSHTQVYEIFLGQVYCEILENYFFQKNEKD